MTVLCRAVLSIVALSLPVLAGGQENANGTELASVTLPSTEVCGKPGGRFNRIVGGSDAEPDMFPWIAAVGYRNYDASNLKIFCTGSLVTDWHLVTTGWCVLHVDEYCKQHKINSTPCNVVARFGVLKLNHVEPTGTEVDYELDTWTEHPLFLLFRRGGLAYDIGVIKLKKRVTFSRFIRPICLPVLSEFRTKNFTGSTGYIAGWSLAEYTDCQEERRLQQTQIRVLEQEKCQEVYEYVAQVTDQFCAVGNDSSDNFPGPFMMPYGPDCSYYLYGVNDFGTSCGTPRMPKVYIRVSEYMDWILSNLK